MRVYEAQLPKPTRSFSPESDHPMSDLSDSTFSDDSPNAIARRRKRHQRRRGKSKKRMSIVANAWKEVSVKEPVNPVGWYEGADVDEKERERAPRYFRSEVGWNKDGRMVLPEEKWRKTLEESYIPQEDEEDEDEEEEEEDEEDEGEDAGEEDEEEEEDGEVDEDQMQEDEDEEEGEIVKMEED